MILASACFSQAQLRYHYWGAGLKDEEVITVSTACPYHKDCGRDASETGSSRGVVAQQCADRMAHTRALVTLRLVNRTAPFHIAQLPSHTRGPHVDKTRRWDTLIAYQRFAYQSKLLPRVVGNRDSIYMYPYLVEK